MTIIIDKIFDLSPSPERIGDIILAFHLRGFRC